ncbi:MAG: hypothetical protein ABWZ25_15600 [Chitinophagaceae bacterium]
MKNFNRKVFVTASMIVGLLVVVSLFGTLEFRSGESHSNFLIVFLSGLFEVLRFPTHTLFPKLAETSSVVFCAGLLINSLFYGLILERLFAVIKSRKNEDHIA